MKNGENPNLHKNEMVLFHHHSSIYNEDCSKAGFGQLC